MSSFRRYLPPTVETKRQTESRRSTRTGARSLLLGFTHSRVKTKLTGIQVRITTQALDTKSQILLPFLASWRGPPNGRSPSPHYALLLYSTAASSSCFCSWVDVRPAVPSFFCPLICSSSHCIFTSSIRYAPITFSDFLFSIPFRTLALVASSSSTVFEISGTFLAGA